MIEFGWSRATISGASSAAFLLSGFLGILVGNLNDKYGPRVIITVTGVFLGCSYLLLSQLHTVWQLYLFYGLVAGIGLSGLSLQEALRSGQLWMLCTINLLAVSCMLTILVHIVPHATDIGLETIKAAGVLSTIGGVSMLGRLSVGIAIDRIGTKKCLMVCLILLILSFFLLNIARGIWMLYFFGAIYGIPHGGIFTVISPIVADLFGIVVFSGTVGGAVGPVLAGLVFDVTRSYHLIFLALVGLASISFLLTLLLKPAISKISTISV